MPGAAHRPRARRRLAVVATTLSVALGWSLDPLAAAAAVPPPSTGTTTSPTVTVTGTLVGVLGETTGEHLGGHDEHPGETGGDARHPTTSRPLQWQLQAPDGPWSLGPSPLLDADTATTGSRVTVTGTADASSRRLTPVRVSPAPAPTGPPANVATAAATGAGAPAATRRTLVLRVTVPGHRQLRDRDGLVVSQPALAAAMRDTAEFYTAASGGALTLTSTVWPTTLALGSDTDPDTCWSRTKVAADATAAADAAGAASATFDHVVMVLPNSMIAACSTGGVAFAQLPGRLVWTYGWISQNALAHELGHNLGSRHSTTYACTDAGGAPTSTTGTCTASEAAYANEDVLGGGRYTQSGYHRALYGWTTPAPATTTGNYLLAPLGAATGAPQSLRVPRADGTYLFVDLRRSGGTPPVSTNSLPATPQATAAPAPVPDARPAAVPSSLASGATLASGGYLLAADGVTRLTMQADGNLVLHNTSTAAVLWSSGTFGNPSAQLVLQADGNLVVRRTNGTAAWISSTGSMPGATLSVVSGQARIVLASSGGRIAWTTAVGLTGNTPSRLAAGQPMSSTQLLRSPDGRFALTMQPDGNLAATDVATSAVVWSTATAGTPGSYMYLQPGGDVVVWSPTASPPQRRLFTTPTAGMGVDRLELGNDGVVRLLLPTAYGSRTVWSSTSGLTGETVDRLNPSSSLASGQALRSPDGNLTATMQPDGNLVVRSAASNTAVWSSSTAGNPSSRLTVQPGGNLTLTATDGRVLWASSTSVASAYLQLSNDGALRLVHPTSGVSFSTGEALVDDPPTGPFTQGVSIRWSTGLTPGSAGALVDTTPGSAGGFRDAPLTVGRELVDTPGGVRVRLDGFDAAGNAQLFVTTPTVVTPAAATVTAARVDPGNTAVVGFTPSTTSSAYVSSYQLARSTNAADPASFAVVATVPATATSASWRSTQEGLWYFRVRPLGATGLPGPWSAATAALRFDLTAPTAPPSLTGTRSAAGVRLTWGASTDAGYGVARYYVMRNGVLIADRPASLARDVTDVVPVANGSYDVVAVDGMGNRSTASRVVVK